MANEIPRYYGFYRAEVIDPNPADYSKYGAIRIFLPDFQIDGVDPDFNDEDDGLLAYPANTSIGGKNPKEPDSFFQGSIMIPPKGSIVFVFFEQGNVSRPFYFSTLNYQLTEIPKEHTLTSEPHKVFTIIKTNSGRTIVVSDADGSERIEITGKKRLLTGLTTPEGDEASTYDIDDNQTTIWLDERSGNEKLLIRTHKGDFINIDIENRNFEASFEGDIKISAGGNISINAGGDIHTKAGNDFYITSNQDVHLKPGNEYAVTAGGSINMLAGSRFKLHAKKGKVKANKGVDRIARSAKPSTPDSGNITR